jgi:hypothetical protein
MFAGTLKVIQNGVAAGGKNAAKRIRNLAEMRSLRLIR